MKKDDNVIVNKRSAKIIGLPGDTYYNSNLKKEIKVPINMICVDINNVLLVFPQSQVKIA